MQDMLTDVIFPFGKYVGFGLFLSAYAAFQFGLVKRNSYVYAGVNAVAAGLIFLGLLAEEDVEELLFQLCWVVISLLGISRLMVLERWTRFSEEETDFLESKLPHLSRRAARLLLDQGEWIDAPAEAVLTREGEPAEALMYLSTGRARIEVAGEEVTHVAAKVLIGEFTVLEQENAIATVTLIEPARCLSIDAAALRALVDSDNEIKTAIQTSFAQEMREKMARANKARIGSGAARTPPSETTDA